MQWWMRPGPSRIWASRNPSPSLPTRFSTGHPDVAVDDLGVGPDLPEMGDGVLHGGHVADDVDPGGAGGDDDHRAALVGVDVGVGHAHDDEEVGHRAVGGEPLVAVDHPLVAVADRRGPDEGGIGPGAGLGHGEGAAQRPVEQRLEPLSRAGPPGPTARCRWPAARRCPSPGRCCRRRPARGRPAQDLVEQSQLHLAEAHAPELGREVGGPHPLALHLLLERAHDPGQIAGVAGRGSRGGGSPRPRRPGPRPAWPRTPARSRSPTPMRLPPGRDRTRRYRGPVPGDASADPHA